MLIAKLVKTPAWIAASLALFLSFNAYASSDGNLCDGLMMIVCAPLGLAESLKPLPPARKMFDAIDKGDLPRLKALLARDPNLLTTDQMLRQAIYSYTANTGNQADEAAYAGRLAVIRYLLDERPKVSQEKLSEMLVSLFHALSRNHDRLEAVANALIDHGASIAKFNISDWAVLDATSEDLLKFALEKGADPNLPSAAASKGNPPALNFLIYHNPRMAEILLQHGADPNLPRGPQERSGLVYFARHCAPDMDHRTKEMAERMRTECDRQSVEEIGLLAKYGADLNGFAETGAHCVTPYLAAREAGNQDLAEKLVALGANPNLCVPKVAGR